jgi:hypothetical protein
MTAVKQMEQEGVFVIDNKIFQRKQCFKQASLQYCDFFTFSGYKFKFTQPECNYKYFK